MGDFFGFRQKGNELAKGTQSQAVDADPSEESGFAADIGRPVWKQFVDNQHYQKAFKESIDAEKSYVAQVDRDNRSSNRAGGAWKASDGIVSRLNRGVAEEYDAESLVDDPELGGVARKSLWDREKKRASADHKASSLSLQDPAFKARELKDKDREDMLAEGSVLAETDARHIELKKRLADDDAYRSERTTLEKSAYDAKVREFNLDQTDPETWWKNKQTADINANRGEIVAQAQAKYLEADAANASADKEAAELTAEAAQGMTAQRSQEVKARQAEISQSKDVAGEVKLDADSKLELTKQAAQAKASAPNPKAETKGDFMRGLETSIRQIPQLAYGVAALAGDTAEKITGFGEDLKSWGLQKYEKSSKAMEPLSKDTDSFSTSWGRATKDGDVGALTDFLQYGIGYFAGQALESAAVAATGAAIGGATTGPAAPVGAVGGAVAGFAAKSAVKKTAKELIEKIVSKQAMAMAEKEAAKMLAKKGVTVSADLIAKRAATTELRKQAAKSIGSTAALIMNGTMMELGSIYPEAVAQAKTEGREMTRADIARIWTSGIVAGGIEGVTDKLGIDLLKGKFADALPGGRVAGGIVGGVADAGVEGATEAVQTGIERFGARQSVTDAEAQKQYIDAAALGAVGGGAMGGAGGFIGGGKKTEEETPPPASQPPTIETVNTSLAGIDPQITPATEEEIAKSSLIADLDQGDAGIAQAVLIERELSAADEAETSEYAAADEAIAQATLAGDTGALTLAQEARDKLPTKRSEAVRAIIKITQGTAPESLTKGQLQSLGLNLGTNGELELQSAEELKKNGLTESLIYAAPEDGSPIVTDEGLRRVAAVSPTAAKRANMTEGQAREKAAERVKQLSTESQNGVVLPEGETTSQEVPGDPGTGLPASAGVVPLETNAPVEFDVPMRDGTMLRVQAEDSNTALEEAAAQGQPISGEPAVAVAPAVASNPAVAVSASAQPTIQPEAAPLPKKGVGAKALKAAQERVAKIAQQSPEIAAALTTGPTGANATTISIDPEAIVAEAVASGMTDKEATARFNAVLDEEIKHFSQRRAAANKFNELNQPGGDYSAWYLSYYGARWQSEFSGEKADVARDIYSKGDAATQEFWDSMSDADKFMEATRMMMQRRDGTVTEQTKLWANISKELFKDLQAMLRELRKMVKNINATPELKADIEFFENELRNVLKQSKSRTGSAKVNPTQPAQSSESAGDVTAPTQDSDSKAASGSGAITSRSDGSSPSLVVGTEVEFVKDGSTIRGVVIQAPNGRVTAIGKDGVEKVLVKHSEGTRGVPVDAITIIGEDFEETKPISAPVAEAPKETETSLRGLNFSVITFENNPTFDQETEKVTRETGTAKVVSMAERQIVLVNIGGVNIPFYLSTGKAGKKNVAAGKWYPILGIDVDGWLNKGSEAEINNYYGSAKLKAAALELDRTLGTTSQSTKVSSKAILGSVNAGLASIGITPTANNEPLTAKRLKDNQQKLLDFFGESDNVSGKKSEKSTGIVDSKEESSDKKPDKKEDNLSQKLQEIEDEYQSALRHADSWAKTDPETAGKKRKAAGMIKAAAIREATGDLTAKEQQKKDAYEASNYTGKPVSVDGRNGKVTGMSFGRVSVKFEDGTSKSFPPDQINPPSSVEAETEASPVTEAPESQQVTPDTLPSVTDEPTSKESSTDENKVLVRPAVESKADSAAQALIEQNKTFLTQANYDALALKRLKMLLKGVQVSTSSEVTETGETATYTVEASAEVKKMKSAKSGYEAVLNCLGGAK